MYYRVAWVQRAIQGHPPPTWQWKSTVLSSLQTVVQLLRLYSALPQDRLRVFSSSSRESLEEQLSQENKGLGSHSVTAAQFLQERMIRSPEGTRPTPALMGASAARSHPSVQENGNAGNGLGAPGTSALERRRLEFERGPGGDHDIPYRFALPVCLPQVLAWMRLLAQVQREELLPQGVLADSNSCPPRVPLGLQRVSEV